MHTSPQRKWVLYRIELQQCYNTSQKNQALNLTVPCCASHCFAFEKTSITSLIVQTRGCRWQVRISRNRIPIGLVKRDLGWKKMSKTRFDRCCRTNKAGIQQQRSILNSRIQRQFQKRFSCQKAEKYPSHKQKDKERQGIKENTSLSNIYWRYY